MVESTIHPELPLHGATSGRTAYFPQLSAQTLVILLPRVPCVPKLGFNRVFGGLGTTMRWQAHRLTDLGDYRRLSVPGGRPVNGGYSDHRVPVKLSLPDGPVNADNGRCSRRASSAVHDPKRKLVFF